jgi:hypothetical protein
MAIPANVVVKPRASTAGVAKEVEEVNQCAAVITKPTAPSPVAAANLIIIDDMMEKLNLLRAKASALGFSIEGEAGRSDDP